jgi:hypothetical protein
VAAAAVTAGTFRKLAFDRPPLGLTLKTGLRDGLRALPVGLLAGLVMALAFGACVIPGFLVGTVLFVVGPVLAVEGGGFKAFKRSAELTKGSRWGLFAVMLAVGVFDGILMRIAFGLLPEEHAVREDLVFDLRAHLAILFVASILVSIARGVASSIAYWDLRGIKESLEVDQLVALVGGRADPTVNDSVDDMIARAQRARRTRNAIAGAIVGLVALGITGYFVRDAIARAREKRRIDAMVEREISRPRPPPTREVEPKASPGSPEVAEEEPTPPVAQKPEIPDSELARSIATGSNKRQAIADAMDLRANDLYGAGLARVFSSVARVQESQLELAVIPVVSRFLGEAGCGDALSEAMKKSSGAYLASHCPAGHVTSSRAPLWATALAMTLEYRAREEKTESSPLHAAVKKALLDER